ncbi:MAG: hypothetical protein WC838_02930 [Candidatus Margulisiibacteriota bacterium]|jgi:cell division protein FtsW (lipid II flippase)
MAKKLLLVMALLLTLGLTTVLAADNAQQQAGEQQQQQLTPEQQLEQVISNINLSFQVMQRENAAVKTYIQYLLNVIVEQNKVIGELSAKAPAKKR